MSEEINQQLKPFTFFISYRRDDTGPFALLLKYEIEKRLQNVRVAIDVSDIKLGEEFPERLNNLIRQADGTIVLIGKNWMPESKKQNDWVVREIQQSLTMNIENSEKSRIIIPIFVGIDAGFSNFSIPEEISIIRNKDAARISPAKWPREIGPLIDEVAVKYGLKKRPDADEYPTPDAAKARTSPMSEASLQQTLKYDDYFGWYIDNFGNADVTYLTKTFKFKSFEDAAEFINIVSQHCKILDHHPEWRNVYDHVTVSLTTWDAHRRVTIYDLNLALYMNKAFDYIN